MKLYYKLDLYDEYLFICYFLTEEADVRVTPSAEVEPAAVIPTASLNLDNAISSPIPVVSPPLLSSPIAINKPPTEVVDASTSTDPHPLPPLLNSAVNTSRTTGLKFEPTSEEVNQLVQQAVDLALDKAQRQWLTALAPVLLSMKAGEAGNTDAASLVPEYGHVKQAGSASVATGPSVFQVVDRMDRRSQREKDLTSVETTSVVTEISQYTGGISRLTSQNILQNSLQYSASRGIASNSNIVFDSGKKAQELRGQTPNLSSHSQTPLQPQYADNRKDVGFQQNAPILDNFRSRDAGDIDASLDHHDNEFKNQHNHSNNLLPSQAPIRHSRVKRLHPPKLSPTPLSDNTHHQKTPEYRRDDSLR